MYTVIAALTVRPSGPGDRPALDALVGRCSPATLYRRFHGAGERPARWILAQLAAPATGRRTFVAVSPGGDVHGTATLAAAGPGVADVAFLVEDAWQRRGVGRSLFAAMAAEAHRQGLAAVTATVHADNERALRFLRAVAPGGRFRFAGGAEVEAAIPLAAGGHASGTTADTTATDTTRSMTREEAA
ncbi:MAG TPA: GNAT family N-acetyltransferase [Acidimicrobiales bacterium]|nr:GNAT family N-acetyltransferase [Acidimicrobiales bacterium]